jgi:hypothetical protein
MNAHLREDILEIAKSAGTIVQCGEGHSEYYHPYDEEADRLAYDLVVAAINDGRFPRSTRLEVTEEFESVLEDANRECPDCARYND